MAEPAFADAIVSKLAVHLGPNVAKMSVDGFARKSGLKSRAELTPQHLGALIEEIRPMLKVMIGRVPTEAVVAEIQRLGK